MKKLVVIILVSVIAISLILIAYFFLTKPKNESLNTNWQGELLAKDGDFVLSGRFSDNKWEYRLNGYLPTPCHRGVLNISTLESYPEKVLMKVIIMNPPADQACVQSLMPYNIEGVLEVSEEADFEISIVTEN